MAFYSDRSFTTYQGRAVGFIETSQLVQRFRLPVVTLVLGAIASLVIAAGALDWLPVGTPLTGELSKVEYLMGTSDAVK
ncbi:hypothetical protein [Pacificibacter sp.]|uniref:hypothetical protein n=1 Tax=Pacificibacter sp. TaxID=1917866 RepID=UPI00321C15D7